MKKVIFSAIAMIAFVGSSMANNEVEKIEIKFDGDPSGCAIIAAAGATLAEEEYHKTTLKCFDSYVFNLLYTIYYNQCLE